MVRKILRRIIRKGVFVVVIGGCLSVNILTSFAEQTENIGYNQEEMISEDAPAVPELPAIPEYPVEPEPPSNPEKPMEPETPVEPETPSDLEKPVVPEAPVTSETSGVSESPVYPTMRPISKVSNMYTNYLGTIGSWYPIGSIFDAREKIKYNTELPIENLPSFITQEMVSGALRCQEEAGFPASVTIAQIIQESGFGQYGAGGEKGQGVSYLAYHYNNLFGIKGVGTAGSKSEKKSSF